MLSFSLFLLFDQFFLFNFFFYSLLLFFPFQEMRKHDVSLFPCCQYFILVGILNSNCTDNTYSNMRMDYRTGIPGPGQGAQEG